MTIGCKSKCRHFRNFKSKCRQKTGPAHVLPHCSTSTQGFPDPLAAGALACTSPGSTDPGSRFRVRVPPDLAILKFSAPNGDALFEPAPQAEGNCAGDIFGTGSKGGFRVRVRVRVRVWYVNG